MQTINKFNKNSCSFIAGYGILYIENKKIGVWNKVSSFEKERHISESER